MPLLKIMLFVLLLLAMSWTLYRQYMRRMHGIDSMNVYRLRLNGTPVYTRLRKFIKAHGLPPAAAIRREPVPIDSPEDLRSLVERAHSTGDELDLCYEGVTMNYFHGERLVITSIDFRKTDWGLDYKGWRFDRNFTYSDFCELFPLSSAMDISGIGVQSLFEINTGEWVPSSESYMVERWSKTNLFAHPTVEFTFLEGKLIYIFFANF